MKRQTFIRTATGSALGLTAAAGGWFILRTNIRVRPLNPESCGRSFLAFCERARFATAEEAVQTVARRGHAFELFIEGDAASSLVPTGESENPQPAPRNLEPVASSQEDPRALDALKTVMTHSRRDPATVVISTNIRTGAAG